MPQRRLLLSGGALAALGLGFVLLRWAPWSDPAAVPPETRVPVTGITLSEPEAPPAPTGPVAVEIAGSAGRLLPVAAEDARTITPVGVAEILAFAGRTGTDALLVWQGGVLQIEHYAEGVQPFDLIDGRGLQAGLMALLVGRAVQQGYVLSLDDKVGGWIPEWREDARSAITFRQLIQGTSGLDPASAGDAAPGSGPTDALSARLAAEPGSRFAPGLLEIQVLGLAIARAVGEPLPQYLSRSLWQPLGARPAEMTVVPDGTPVLTCCIRATARDWLRLGLLVLEGGSVDGQPLVPTPWVDEMGRHLPQSRHDGTRLRLAWPHDPGAAGAPAKPFREPDTQFFAGEGGQRLYIAKGADLVILRLGAPVADWDDSVLPNLVSAHLDVPAPPPRRSGGDLSGLPLPPITVPPPVPVVESVPLEGEGPAMLVPPPPPQVLPEQAPSPQSPDPRAAPALPPGSTGQ